MSRWCKLNVECRSEAGCARPLTSNGRYPCADPHAHTYVVADRKRPEDGCRHCGYLEAAHSRGHVLSADCWCGPTVEHVASTR
jgi:hypothetical protein